MQKLIEMAENGKGKLASNCIGILGIIGSPKALKALKRHLIDGNPEEKYEAIRKKDDIQRYFALVSLVDLKSIEDKMAMEILQKEERKIIFYTVLDGISNCELSVEVPVRLIRNILATETERWPPLRVYHFYFNKAQIHGSFHYEIGGAMYRIETELKAKLAKMEGK